jgi:hypothetical protein
MDEAAIQLTGHVFEPILVEPGQRQELNFLTARVKKLVGTIHVAVVPTSFSEMFIT